MHPSSSDNYDHANAMDKTVTARGMQIVCSIILTSKAITTTLRSCRRLLQQRYCTSGHTHMLSMTSKSDTVRCCSSVDKAVDSDFGKNVLASHGQYCEVALQSECSQKSLTAASLQGDWSCIKRRHNKQSLYLVDSL